MPAKSRKPPKKIEGPLVDHMHACGVTVDDLAYALGVARRAIWRIGTTNPAVPRKKCWRCSTGQFNY